MTQVRVNIRSIANSKTARKEKRNGRDVWIVPSATLPDNVIMNGVRYPADEIEKSYKTLNRTPAPLGHPTINGKFVSASDPEGINLGYIGAWNENVRREGGRVLLDKIIDIEVANRSEGGKAVLSAINAGSPVHTSTGLLCRLEVSNDEAAKHNAKDILFDHDAILLNEEGAATPEQGVGMLVNASGEAQEIEVINSSLLDEADREVDWAGMRLIEAMERRDRATLWDRMKSAFQGAMPTERETQANRKEIDMPIEKEQFDELSAKVNSLSETVEKMATGLPEAISNAVKPLTDNLAEMQANAKAKEDAEKADLVAQVVKANVLDEDAAKELTVNALRKLAEKAKPGKAAALNAGGFGGGQADDFAGYDINKMMEAK